MYIFCEIRAEWYFWHVIGREKTNFFIMRWMMLFILMTLSSVVPAQQQDITELLSALKSGNAQQVSEHFDAMVDLKFPEKDEIKNVGRNQAEMALRNFFSENNIRGFEKVSDREIGNTMYITGRLLNDGKGYSATFMLRLIKGRHYIITVRIN